MAFLMLPVILSFTLQGSLSFTVVLERTQIQSVRDIHQFISYNALLVKVTPW